MLQFLRSLQRDDRGVTILEYAALGAIMVAAVVAGTALIKVGLTSAFTAIAAAL